MKTSIVHKLIPLLSLLLLSLIGQGQIETGRPHYRNYPSSEYRAHGQNFAALQDDRGVMYFANTAGILEFDGKNWRLINTAEGTMVRALALGPKGQVYVGSRGEIGYLNADPSGRVYFVSLNRELPADSRNFKEIRWVLSTSEEVCFLSDYRLMSWKDETLSVHRTDEPIVGAWKQDGEVCVQLETTGIHQWKNGQLQAVNTQLEGANWTDFVISTVQPFGADKWLIGSLRNGLFVWEQGTIKPLESNVNALFREAFINTGATMPDGSIAFGTAYQGIVIVDQQGQFLRMLNRETGLPDQSVSHLLLDREQGVWACLNNGISRLELASPFHFFGAEEGLEGQINDVIRYQGQFFAATSQGLFRFVPSDPATGELVSRFEAVPGVIQACYDLLQYEDELFLATAGGVLAYDGQQFQELTDEYAFSLIEVPGRPGEFLTGELRGIGYYLAQSGGFKMRTRWLKLGSEITELSAVGEEVWAASQSNGLFRLGQTVVDGSTWMPQAIDTAMGLPSLLRNRLVHRTEKLLVATSDGILEFDAQAEKLQPASIDLDEQQNEWWSLLMPYQDGYLAVDGDEKEITWFRQQEGELSTDRSVFAPLDNFTIRMIEPEANGNVWLGGPEGLMLFDQQKVRPKNTEYGCLLRSVHLRSDSLFYGGLTLDEQGKPIPYVVQNNGPLFEYTANYLRFGFAAPTFDRPSQVRYRFMLEGFDDIWSPWADLTQKEYTNLATGDYVFRVQAKNVYGNLSTETAYPFVILTPWFQQWWAYAIYVILFIALVMVAGKIRSAQLEKEKKALEKVIEERTAEVVDQKEEIELQSEVLAIKNKELEKINQMVKSINSGISFTSVLQTIIEEMRIIKGVERAAGYVRDAELGTYVIRSHFGWDPEEAEACKLSQADAEDVFVSQSLKVGEDIFFRNAEYQGDVTDRHPALGKPAATLTLIIRIEDETEGFLVLENSGRNDAFKEQDFELIGNFKEHITSAFIKSRILDNLQVTLTNLKEAQAKLVSQEKMAGLGQLTAGIAHEINNPINFVSGNIKPLRRDIADVKEILEKYAEIKESSDLKELLEEIEELKEDIDLDYVLNELDDLINDIENGAQRTAEIVRELRDFSRLDEDNVKMADLEVGIDSTLKILKNKYKEKAEIVKEYAEIPEIECFPGKINQVFMNILTNGIQAIPDKGTVTITTKDLGEEVSITIKDNGSGMTEETRKKIYDPFYTTKDVGEGTGLGMSISYGIIKDHNGRIELESELGVGTEFTIVLPKKQPQKD